MMPYQSYQIYQAERPKSAAEIRRADEQLGAEPLQPRDQQPARGAGGHRGADRGPHGRPAHHVRRAGRAAEEVLRRQELRFQGLNRA